MFGPDVQFSGLEHATRGMDSGLQNLTQNDAHHASQSADTASSAFGGACQRALNDVVSANQSLFSTRLAPGMQETVDGLIGARNAHFSGQDAIVSDINHSNTGIASAINGI